MAKFSRLLASLLCFFLASSGSLAIDVDLDGAGDESLNVLGKHKVVRYSEPLLKAKYVSDATVRPKGMQHVYSMTHAFLDLVQRRQVLPDSLLFLDAPPGSAAHAAHAAHAEQAAPAVKLDYILREHWQEVLLQYIGVVTIAICGLLAAIVIPLVGFCMCCCRCAGKCGGYPEHFDRQGDPCRRVNLGVILSLFVICAMFGVVTAFVTNHYAHQGVTALPGRLQNTVVDAGTYMDNTGREIQILLVDNFSELEKVLNDTLDESGPILKRNLARITQAVAIDNLADIVSGLGKVRGHLKSIQNNSILLGSKIEQLKLGLGDAQRRLTSALRQCSASKACQAFLDEYNVQGLSLTEDFRNLPQRLPDVGLLMGDIQNLMDSNIENRVRGGQRQLDKVKVDIEKSIGDLRPQIKAEIRRMGNRLSEKSAEIQGILKELNGNLSPSTSAMPPHPPTITIPQYAEAAQDYLHYIGLGMASLVLIILCCFILGLFYGFCGKRPGNDYGDDCCNKGTGANWLLAGTYLTFLFSFVLLTLTTAQFLVGSTVEKVACETLQNPVDSEFFKVVDSQILQPLLQQSEVDSEMALLQNLSVREIISECHRNMTIYRILKLHKVYDVEGLRGWRQKYEVGSFLDNLKSKIRTEDLSSIQILSPQARKGLEALAESQLSDLNFTTFTRLIEEQVTSIDVGSFVRRLRQVRERLGSSGQVDLLVGPALENEALFLDQMQQVVMEMKLIVRKLRADLKALEGEAKFNKASMREALVELIRQASKATDFLRSEGPQLVEKLGDSYVNETVGLIDEYVERVITYANEKIAKCHPLSNGYNATVVALCQDIVDPFNGFWASVGWCYMFFLPSTAIALSLVSLYRKSEPYSGALVEPLPDDVGKGNRGKKGGGGGGRGRGRGHRRNLSEYLPDSAHHYRAGYSYQSDGGRFQDVAPRNQNGGNRGGAPTVVTSSSVGHAEVQQQQQQLPSGGPPMYTSNPHLDNPEYERPPPYYYPGALPAGVAPPPLPAPNAVRT